MIGSKLGERYEILDELGRGGMGVVYLARDPLLEREVAIKLVPPTLLNRETEERLRREAKTVARMDHHAIVPVHDLGTHEGSLYFVMPVVRGDDLRHVIPTNALKVGHVIDIGTQVARALEYSHTRGILHRDIKPSNIMVSRESQDRLRVRIMDFGLARSELETRMTRSGDLVGTMSYLSPEQVSGREVDARSDIYSLGCVLYECFCGEPPFRGDVHSTLYRIVYEDPRPLHEHGIDLDPELEAVIMKCMAKNAADRHQSAREFHEELERIRERLAEEERNALVAAATRTAPRPRPNVTPFVGREREFSQLQDRLTAALEGECQFVLVGGDVGVGKSRLLEHFEDLLRAKKITALRGRFVDDDQRIPYFGFCEVIQDWFRRKETGSSSTSAQDLSDLADDLTSHFPVLAEIEPLRNLTTSREESGSTIRSPETDKNQVFELLSRTIGRLAGGRPLVLLLEDLHQGEVSIEALQYVIRRLAPTPTLIVGTWRPRGLERDHPLVQLAQRLDGDRRFERIELDPLSHSEHEELVRTILGGSALAEDLGEKLYAATEGNPLFTKEIVRSLIDSDVIVEDDSNSWTLSPTRDLSAIELPATIQQAVEKHVDSLSESSRDVLSIASVLGKTFEYRDLESLAQDRTDVDELVDRLVRDGILEEIRSSREDRLAFASGIVRDVLYSTLTRRRRRSLHRRAGEALEHRFIGRLNRVAHRLMHHFSEADVPDKAIEHALRAAQASLEAYDPHEAIRAVRTALEFLDDERWERDPLVEGEAALMMAAAHRLLGAIDTALRSAKTAVATFEGAGAEDRALEAMLLAAEAAWEGRRIRQATQWVERGTTLATRAGRTETRRRIFTLAATLANLRGDYDRARGYMDQRQKLDPEKERSAAPEGGEVVVALAHPISTPLDPAAVLTLEEIEIVSNVAETLFVTDARGNLAPGICAEWDVVEGGRAVNLKLHTNVRFHDDRLLTAADVKASLERSIATTFGAALSVVRGADAFSSEENSSADHVEGLVVVSEHELRIDLREPFHIFPALLSDPSTGIFRTGEDGRIIGTGPFVVDTVKPHRVRLLRNPTYWKAQPAAIDALEFRMGMDSGDVTEALRAREVDVARDLNSDDLDRLMRDGRFRGRIVEAARKNLYYIAFNQTGPLASRPKLRRALASSLDTRHLVWTTVGRFAEPATGMYPPGMIGHDPARRQAPPIDIDRARELLREAGVETPVKLRAAVHPVFRDRYDAMLRGILDTWKELGVRVKIVTSSMASFLAAFDDNATIDMIVMRWNADYDDPDSFAWALFHSRDGVLRRYFSSAETDAIAAAARAEPTPEGRQKLYNRFESILFDRAALVPLYYDLDYRVISPDITRLRLQSTPPFVNYSELGKLGERRPRAATRVSGGVLSVPFAGRLQRLDPALSRTVTAAEVLPCVFETLTHVSEGGRVSPWLAAEWSSDAECREWRFRLRSDVYFHDGRRLTARTVRASFERLLATRGAATQVLSQIKGAVQIMQGETRELEGINVLSDTEFIVSLEAPVSILPHLLAHSTTAIVPEGSPAPGSVADPQVGTGPFRVAHFVANDRLEVEANRNYWQDDVPRSDGIVFSFRVPPSSIIAEFQKGQFSLAGDMAPLDVETLRYGSTFAAGYRECPGLSTSFLILNAMTGQLADADRRRVICDAIDVPTLVQSTFGRLATPADGLIPPGLVGYQRTRRTTTRRRSDDTTPCRVTLRAAVMTTPTGHYRKLADQLFEQLEELGIAIEIVNTTPGEFFSVLETGDVDLVLGRWTADYPDPDSFFHGLFDSRTGVARRLYSSDDIDRAIERGRAEVDPDDRHALYRDLDRTLVRQAIVLPILHEQLYRFARPEVEGLSVRFARPVVAYEQLKLRS